MDQLQQVPLTLCLAKAGLAAGTTNTLSTTAALTYGIKGKAYSKAAITNGATPTIDAASGAAFVPIAANQGTVIVLALDANGNLNAAQGQVQALDVAGNFILAPQLPDVPDTVCPIGYIVLKAGATLAGSWQFGTGNLSGVAGMSYAFQDLIGMPARPQVA